MAGLATAPATVVGGTVVADAPPTPMATVMAQPMAAQPMVAQPMMAQQPMAAMPQPTVVPMLTALGNQDGLPASPLVLGPPHPCKKKGNDMQFAPADKLQGHFSTGSPRATYAYVAPSMDGTLTEADFDRAVCLADAEQGDPLAALLSDGRKVLELAIDVEGRLNDMKKVLKNNCLATIGCLLNPLCTLCVLCEMANGNHPAMSWDGEGKEVEKLRVQAGAHHLALTDRAVVYTRDAHVGVTVKNYIAYDQYGHRYPGVSQSDSQVPAATLHVPLQHADLEVVAKKEIAPTSLNVYGPSEKCCDSTPDSQVIVLRVGEGVRLVVACVEVGPASNAAAFVSEFTRIKQNAPALSPEVAAAYNAWFGQRLARSGTMAGAAPRANQTMDRAGVPGVAGGQTVNFVRSVGPLPHHLQIVKNSMSANRMLHFDVPKSGNINSIRSGAFVGQLNAEDRILSINNVRCTGELTQQYLDQAQAASPPAGGGFMQVSTPMPHYQPSHMISVGPMPCGATTGIQFAADRMPPLILQPDAAAAASGMCKGDIVMQAIVDGVTHNTNGMTGQQLLSLTQAAGATVLTVLQTHRMPSGPASELPWVPYDHLRR